MIYLSLKMLNCLSRQPIQGIKAVHEVYRQESNLASEASDLLSADKQCSIIILVCADGSVGQVCQASYFLACHFVSVNGHILI